MCVSDAFSNSWVKLLILVVTYKRTVQQRNIDVERKIYRKNWKRDRKGGLLVETHDSTMSQWLNALDPVDPSSLFHYQPTEGSVFRREASHVQKGLISSLK